MPRPNTGGEFHSPTPAPKPYQVFIIPLSADSKTIYTLPGGKWIGRTVRKTSDPALNTIKKTAADLLKSEKLTTIRHAVTLVDTHESTTYYIFAWLVEGFIPTILVSHNTSDFVSKLSDERLQAHLCTQLPAGLVRLPDGLAHRSNHGHTTNGYNQ